MIDFTTFYVCYEPAFVLAVNHGTGAIQRISNTEFERRVGGWRGAIRLTEVGQAHSVRQFRYDPRADDVRIDRDEFGASVTLGPAHLLALAAGGPVTKNLCSKVFWHGSDSDAAWSDLRGMVETLKLAQVAIVNGGKVAIPDGHPMLDPPRR